MKKKTRKTMTKSMIIVMISTSLKENAGKGQKRGLELKCQLAGKRSLKLITP